jgi:hypothetical protein
VLKWLRHSRVAGVVAVLTNVLALVDAAGAVHVLPPTAAAAVGTVAGLVAWYNKTLRSDGRVATDAALRGAQDP